MQDLIDKFHLNSDKKFFLIFDVDGTLRPDTVTALDHRYPKIDPETAMSLRLLNTHEKVQISILTARSYVDIFRSNIPNNITKYCGFGKQIVENDILRYPRPEFARAYDEITVFVDLIKDILGPVLTANLDFLVTPGDFALYFEANDYQEKKAKIKAVLEMVFANSQRWHIEDLGKEIIFKDSKYTYNKGDAIFDILDALNLQALTHVYLFGDSDADYKAMVALRDYQKLHPQKRLKVTNIAVGHQLDEREAVDISFDSYKDTLKFVSVLHDMFLK